MYGYISLILCLNSLLTLKTKVNCFSQDRGAKQAADQAFYTAVMCSRDMFPIHGVWNIYLCWQL